MAQNNQVDLLSKGGSSKTIRVQATSPDKAKAAAVAMASAEARASNSPYEYQPTSCLLVLMRHRKGLAGDIAGSFI